MTCSVHNRRRGSDVAEIYRGLDNRFAVIMYSARGTVEDWFRVGNRHIFGYVHKNSSRLLLEELVAMVQRGGHHHPLWNRTSHTPNRRCALSRDRIAGPLGRRLWCSWSKRRSVQGSHVYDDRNARAGRAGRTRGRIARRRPVQRQAQVLETIERICGVQPRPQIVIGCEGRDESEDSIMHVLNARPFRMIDLLSADASQALADAVRAAAAWYGGNEYFSVESEYVHRAAADIDWQELDQQLGDRDAEDPVSADEDTVPSAEENCDHDA